MKSPKVIMYFVEGFPYTFKDCYVDCNVIWQQNQMTLISTIPHVPNKIVQLHGVIVVEQHHDYDTITYTNPKYCLSIQTSIMTAKQRSRLNNHQHEVSFLGSVLTKLVRKIFKFLKG